MDKIVKSEKTLSIISLCLGIVSTLMLFKVLSMQHKYFNLKLEEEDLKRNGFM